MKTSKSLSQYVDVGNLSSACVTTSETCGPEVGAISLWFKLDACETGGMISSRLVRATTGLQLNYDADVLR